MSAESDRRKYLRVDSNYIIRCERYPLAKDDSIRLTPGITKNVSTGGILFESRAAFKIGDSLRIELRLPGWKDFVSELRKPGLEVESDTHYVIGTAVRVELVDESTYDVGVSFAEMDKNVRWALMKYIYERVENEQN